MAKILVVDDEVSLLQLLETYLKRQGHEVVCCDNGAAGLAAVEKAEGGFALAVLDHWLPDMSGMDLLNGVLERQADIKVLVSSGSFMDIGGLAVPAGRTVGFLQKPYLPKALLETVAKLLESEA